MRFLSLSIVLFMASCGKSEPTKQAEPAASGPAAPAAAAPTPTPTPAPAPPAPPPPAADPMAAAIKATIQILEAVTPITKQYGKEDCKAGMPELEKVLAGMTEQSAAIAKVYGPAASRESSIAYSKAYWKQDEGPLDNAKSDALGPALHCPDLVDRIMKAFGMAPIPR